MSGHPIQRSESNSSQSTSLSDFVRQRWSGQTPVWGGDPRVGATEFASAANTDLARAMTQLTGALQSFGAVVGQRVAAPRVPIAMLPETVEAREDIVDAIKLEDDKIQTMLMASAIEPRDIQRYYLLFVAAKDALMKKEAAMRASDLRKTARIQSGFVMSFSVTDLPDNEERIQAVADKFGFDISQADDVQLAKLMMLHALTHDSFTQGRETNRVLAYVGDAAMRVAIGRYAFDTRMPVSDVSDMVQQCQSNKNLRDIGVRLGIASHVRVGDKVDATAKTIMATVVEAVLGVIYFCVGESAMAKSMSEIGISEAKTPVVAAFAATV